MIENKIANSGLINFDLGDYYPKNERFVYDIKQNLWQGIALREQEFRDFLKEHDWSQYQDKFVSITCSEDAIIPNWAYMLLTSHLSEFAAFVCFGNKEDLEKAIAVNFIDSLDILDYNNGRILVKGCSDVPNPELLLVELTKKLKPVVKSLMFGEACSNVPVYKAKV